MPDLDEQIWKLKAKGLSLRKIAATLSISHEAVRKRLKAIEVKDRVSANPEDLRLTAAPTKNKKLSTFSKAHQSRASEELGDTVNLKTPSHIPAPGVNPPEKRSNTLPECRKGAFQGVFLEVGDLFGAIREFLKSQGIQLYRMQLSGEAYQVKHNGEVIRFYVQRKIGMEKAREERE